MKLYTKTLGMIVVFSGFSLFSMEQPKVADLNAQLIAAIKKGEFNVVKNLLDKGANVIAEGKFLLWAVAKNDKDIAELLLQRGANVNLESKVGDVPLKIAIHRHNKDMVEFLIDKGAKVNAVGTLKDNMMQKTTPLTWATYWAINTSDNNKAIAKDITELLIDNDARIDLVDNNGNTPLTTAILTLGITTKDIVKFLIDKGADITRPGSSGETPLILAKRWNADPGIIKLLTPQR